MNLPKWIINGLGGLLIVFVALGILQKGHTLKQDYKNARPTNTISVSGQGKVNATPDLGVVSVGVLSQGKTAVDVKNENNDKVNKVIAFIKSQGVNEKDITTSQFSFYPLQDYNNGSPRITGYQGNQVITVKFRGVGENQEQMEKVLDGAVNNGANEIQNVSLTVENPTDLQNEARKLAIADARKKAEELAKEAGLSLGKIVSVSESSGGWGIPMPYASEAAMGRGGADMKLQAPNIQPGTQEITEIMTVVFELE